MEKTNYSVESIKTLSPRDSVRLRFGMYIGDNGNRGFHQLFYEVFSNSIDESINGFGDTIIVRLLERNTIEMEDFGRGIPFGKNKAGSEVLEMTFSNLHTGGKIDNTQDTGGYKYSGGTNGVGTSIVNFLSTRLDIEVVRDGKVANLLYENGETEGTKISKSSRTDSGTKLRFTPDLTIFPGIKGFDSDYLKRIIQDQVYLQKITVIFEDCVNNETIRYENSVGIEKFLLEKNNEKVEKEDGEEPSETEVSEANNAFTPITSIVSGVIETKVIDDVTKREKDVGMDYAFEFVAQNRSSVRGYTNSISNFDGGTHIAGFKSGIYKGVTNLLEKGKIEDKALLKDVIQEDITGSLVGIISVRLMDPTFEGQTKGKLTNAYVKKVVSEHIAREVEKNLSIEDFAKVRHMILSRIKFRKKVEEESIQLEKAMSDSDVRKRLGTKLKDASTKIRKDAELFIVEGDSASGGLKKERNPEIHAIMPLRGKVLNVIKDSNKKKIFSNQEINNLMYAISGGYIGEEFDLSKCRYGKIIILADADSDGLHITLLVLTFLLKFYPTLIENGYIYIGIAPLFVCKHKNDFQYFYSEQEMNKFLNSGKGKLYSINRFKGLGEMDSEDLHKVALGRERTLMKVAMDDAEDAYMWFNEIMGSDPKKKYDFLVSYLEILLKKVEENQLGLSNKKKDIVEIAKDNAGLYSIEVNEERAIPMVEDGLKNVHRRILYTLKKDLRSTSTGDFIKSAKVIGATMGEYHPHGDSSIFEAMVGLTQDFSNNQPLIQGKGAFGSIFDKGGVAAPRYSEVKIASISERLLLDGIEKDAVKMRPNYSNTSVEPVVLPAKIPFCLINDSMGIAFGLSSCMVSHNIREVIQALIGYLENQKGYNASDYIKGPDAPVDSILMNTTEEIREIYTNPKGGAFIYRTPLNAVKDKNGYSIEITNVSYLSYDAETLEEKITKLIEDKKIHGAKEIVDRSGKSKTTKQLCLSIKLMGNADPRRTIADLYKYTVLETKVYYKPLLINRDKKLKLYTLNEIIATFIEFRKETARNVLTFEIAKLGTDILRQESRKIFAMNIDEIVAIIKANKDRTSIKEKICSKFSITEEMAEIIITTQLINIKDLTAIEDELKKLDKQVKSKTVLLESDKKLSKYLLDEYQDLLEEFKGIRRKTKLLTKKEISEILSFEEGIEKLKKEEAKKVEKKKNAILIYKDGFLEKITGKPETLTEAMSSSSVVMSTLNDNTGTLYVFDATNGYSLPISKMKEKSKFALSKLFDGISQPVAIFSIDEDDITPDAIVDKAKGKMIGVLYEEVGKKGDRHLGGYKILLSDFVKARKKFSIGKNRVVAIYELKDGKEGKYDVSKLNFSGKPISNEELPVRKSISSGARLRKG